MTDDSKWTRLVQPHKGAMTVKEWKALLASDPEWVALEKEREAELKAAAAKFRLEEEPILADLAKAGFRKRQSVYDLVNTTTSYPRAIPVLLKHLAAPYHHRIREGIARALTVVEARGVAGPEILTQLEQIDDVHDVQWALANALTVVATRADAPRIKSLLDSGRFEGIGERLQVALKKAKRR